MVPITLYLVHFMGIQSTNLYNAPHKAKYILAQIPFKLD